MPEILAKFKGRESLRNYTIGLLDLLKSDPCVEYIINSITNEVIYSK